MWPLYSADGTSVYRFVMDPCNPQQGFWWYDVLIAVCVSTVLLFRQKLIFALMCLQLLGIDWCITHGHTLRTRGTKTSCQATHWYFFYPFTQSHYRQKIQDGNGKLLLTKSCDNLLLLWQSSTAEWEVYVV
jgi:hypothetical protein